MKPISHATLLRKSRNARNEEQIMKLAQNDSLQEWSKTETVPSPAFVKQPKVKWSVFMWNVSKNALDQLNP